MTLTTIILLPVFLIAATASNFGCSSGYKVNTSEQSNSKVSNSGASGDVKQQDLRTEAMRTALKRENSKLNLEDLKDVSLGPSESEMRFWVGFGLVVPRCFVLKRENNSHQARYLTIQDSSVTATSLTQPQSGWEAFDQLLRDFRVTSPIDLKPDDQHLADPDEEVIAIELKSGQRYDLVYYSVGTQSESGKSVIRLCRTIEKEFAIRLRCQG